SLGWRQPWMRSSRRSASAGPTPAWGWLTASPDALPAPLEAMSLGRFEPDVWIPSAHPAAPRGVVTPAEPAGLDVSHRPRRPTLPTPDTSGPRRRGGAPRPPPPAPPPSPPPRRGGPPSPPPAARPAAVLPGPAVIAGPPPGVIRLPRPAGTGDMTRVGIVGHP